eukprot:GFKZ01004819.1.p1 GENE.GFKZ01004819.1~~GFKZ01004819.1.p1  ORF type:complete len:458 (-),score=99.40 GFKZ01004819.1:2456-3829(-)
MKRRRTGALTCPYVQCHQKFSTARQLALHEASHAADKPHQCLECRRRFATVAQLDEHVADIHPSTLNLQPGKGAGRKRRRKTDADEEVLAVNDIEQMEEGEKRQRAGGGCGGGDEEEQEAREIAENGAYLMSRIKIARSYGIGKWDKKDFKNAYLWAMWVQGAVEDFGEGDFLDRVLQKRGLSLSCLQHAERILVDSVLGFEGLTSEMLSYLIESVINGDGGAEEQQGSKEEAERRLDGLVAAMVAGVERKTELKRLHGMLSRLNGFIDEEKARQDEKWVSVAKGKILLKRHERMEVRELREHLQRVGEAGADAELMGVLVEEMKISDGMVKRELFDFFGGMLDKEGVRLVRRVGGEMVALCELDVELFGRYLKLLLTWKGQGDGGQGNRDRIVDLIVEGKISFRQAAEERVREGWVSDEEVRKWISDLMQRKGIIGYMTKMIMDEFERRKEGKSPS